MTAAAGCLSLALAGLETTLADCAAFRALTTPPMADAAAAKARIHLRGLPEPSDGLAHTIAELDAYRPFAILWTDPDNGFASTSESSGGDHNEFSNTGTLFMELEVAYDSGDDKPTADENVVFENAVGAIIDDLQDLAGGPGYLNILAIGLDYGPFWPAPEDIDLMGTFQGARLTIEYKGPGE
jgi:hypothetical protein